MALLNKYCKSDAGGAGDGLSWDTAWDLDDMIAGAAAGDLVNIRGTFAAIGASKTFATSAGATTPIHIRGCTANAGDGGFATFAFANTFGLTTSGKQLFWENIAVTGNINASLWTASGTGSLYYHCKSINSASGATGGPAWNCSNAYARSVGCYFQNASTGTTPGSHACVVGQQAAIQGCRIIAATYAVSLTPGFGACVFDNNVVSASSGTAGCYVDTLANCQRCEIIRNTINGFTDGIYFVALPDIGDSSDVVVLNNLIVSCTDGIHNAGSGTVTTTVFLLSNAFYNCTNDLNGFTDVPHPGKVTISDGSPFVDTTDFVLNSTALRGALCKGTALPTDPDCDGTQENWQDIGALQRQESVKLVGMSGGTGG